MKDSNNRDLVYVEVLPHPVNRVYLTDADEYPVTIDQVLEDVDILMR